MAEVDDSAQMIIIGGFIIAIGLVAVATILNGLIFSQNLASRGSQVHDDLILEIKEVTTNESIQAIRYTNKHDINKEPLEAESMYGKHMVNYTRAVRNLSLHTQAYLAVNEDPNGVWDLVQNQSENFTDSGGMSDWDLTQSDVETTYRLNLTDVSHTGGGDFTVRVVDPLSVDDVWRMNLTSSSVEVTDGASTKTYSVSYPITVEVMNGSGSIDGSNADLLSDAIRNENNPYKIRFEGGNNVEGKYYVRVGPRTIGLGTGPCSTGLNPTCVTSDGRVVGVVHNASVEIVYFDPKVNFTEVMDVTEDGEVR